MILHTYSSKALKNDSFMKMMESWKPSLRANVVGVNQRQETYPHSISHLHNQRKETYHFKELNRKKSPLLTLTFLDHFLT